MVQIVKFPRRARDFLYLLSWQAAWRYEFS